MSSQHSASSSRSTCGSQIAGLRRGSGVAGLWCSVPAVSSGIRGPVHVRLGAAIEAKGIPGAVPPNRIRYVLFERLGLDAVSDFFAMVSKSMVVCFL
jgi:hypothetical protein